MQDPLPGSLILVAHAAGEVRSSLSKAFEAEGCRVLAVQDGAEAVELARRYHPQLVVLDLALPRLSGLEAARILRAEMRVPIFLLADPVDDALRFIALAAGADDILPKSTAAGVLVERARAVLGKRSSREAGPLLMCGPLAMDLSRREVTLEGRPLSLTPLEFRLLQVFLEAPGHVFSRDELLTRLHDVTGSTPLDRAIDNLVVRLRRKLRDNPRRPRFIEAVRGVGYRLRERGQGMVRHHTLFQEAFQSLPLPLAILDAERTLILLNPAGERLIGVKAREVVGRAKCFELLSCHTKRGCPLQEACLGIQAMRQSLPHLEASYLVTTKVHKDLPVLATYCSFLAEGHPHCLIVLNPRLPIGTYSRKRMR
ncbi:MAG: winged helix-turn-helix domain-containing protein [Armatimonadota bacterium]|nr:winged helix-turn-helix domain-containing protein [Armatimonadota bacterium]